MKRINIKGPIVSNDDKWIYEWLEMEATCPKDVVEQLEGLAGEDILVNINSGGGDVHSASEIYTELREYNGQVETRVVGLGASAASVIAMAGNISKMAPTAELMIHNASTISWGDHRDMDKAAEMLRVTNKAISSAYRQKTGMTEEELLTLMNDETWMDAETAKEKGFIDEIMFENEQVRMVASAPGALPQKVIDKIRNDALKKPETVNAEELNSLFAQAEERIAEKILMELKAQNKIDKKEPNPTPGKNNAPIGFFLNLK